MFGKILPEFEKEPKLQKKAVFGHFFFMPIYIEQKIPYVQYFFSNYVEFTVHLVFLCQIMLNFFQILKYCTFGNFLMISGRFFLEATTCRQISAVFFDGRHLLAIPNPLTSGFEKNHTYGNFFRIGCS